MIKFWLVLEIIIGVILTLAFLASSLGGFVRFLELWR